MYRLDSCLPVHSQRSPPVHKLTNRESYNFSHKLHRVRYKLQALPSQSLQSVCFQTGYLNTDSLTMSYEDMSPLTRSRRRGMDIRTHRWCHHCRRPYTRYMYIRHHELHDVHIPVIQATLPLDPAPRQLQDITGQYF